MKQLSSPYLLYTPTAYDIGICSETSSHEYYSGGVSTDSDPQLVRLRSLASFGENVGEIHLNTFRQFVFLILLSRSTPR